MENGCLSPRSAAQHEQQELGPQLDPPPVLPSSAPLPPDRSVATPVQSNSTLDTAVPYSSSLQNSGGRGSLRQPAAAYSSHEPAADAHSQLHIQQQLLLEQQQLQHTMEHHLAQHQQEQQQQQQQFTASHPDPDLAASTHTPVQQPAFAQHEPYQVPSPPLRPPTRDLGWQELHAQDPPADSDELPGGGLMYDGTAAAAGAVMPLPGVPDKLQGAQLGGVDSSVNSGRIGGGGGAGTGSATPGGHVHAGLPPWGLASGLLGAGSAAGPAAAESLAGSAQSGYPPAGELRASTQPMPSPVMPHEALHGAGVLPSSSTGLGAHSPLQWQQQQQYERQQQPPPQFMNWEGETVYVTQDTLHEDPGSSPPAPDPSTAASAFDTDPLSHGPPLSLLPLPNNPPPNNYEWSIASSLPTGKQQHSSPAAASRLQQQQELLQAQLEQLRLQEQQLVLQQQQQQRQQQHHHHHHHHQEQEQLRLQEQQLALQQQRQQQQQELRASGAGPSQLRGRSAEGSPGPSSLGVGSQVRGRSVEGLAGLSSLGSQPPLSAMASPGPPPPGPSLQDPGLEQQLAALQMSARDMEQDLRRQLLEAEHQIRDKDVQLAAAEGKEEALQAEVQTGRSRVDALQAELAMKDGRMESLQAELLSARRELDHERLKGAEGGVGMDRLKAELLRLRGELNVAQKKLELSTDDERRLRLELQGLHKENGALTDASVQLKVQLSEEHEKLRALFEEQQRFKAQAARAEMSSEGLALQVQELRLKCIGLEDQASQMKHELFYAREDATRSRTQAEVFAKRLLHLRSTMDAAPPPSLNPPPRLPDPSFSPSASMPSFPPPSWAGGARDPFPPRPASAAAPPPSLLPPPTSYPSLSSSSLPPNYPDALPPPPPPPPPALLPPFATHESVQGPPMRPPSSAYSSSMQHPPPMLPSDPLRPPSTAGPPPFGQQPPPSLAASPQLPTGFGGPRGLGGSSAYKSLDFGGDPLRGSFPAPPPPLPSAPEPAKPPVVAPHMQAPFATHVAPPPELSKPLPPQHVPGLDVPYGTERTLQDFLERSQALESQVVKLSQEKGQLEAEYAKMPLHGGRTARERTRKAEVEGRIEALNKAISQHRLALKQMLPRGK